MAIPIGGPEQAQAESMGYQEATGVSLKTTERSDGHWDKALVFGSAAVAIKALKAQVDSVSFIKFKELPQEAVVGVLAVVAIYHIAMAAIVGRKAERFAQHASTDFRKIAMGREFKRILASLLYGILATVFLCAILRKDLLLVVEAVVSFILGRA